MVLLILKAQQSLPWFCPQYHTTVLTPDLSLNTAISFSTTTTWQAYAGENTMTYFSRMVGLCAQNFLAGAAGLAVGVAFIRGMARQLSGSLGNFWEDLTRSAFFRECPLSDNDQLDEVGAHVRAPIATTLRVCMRFSKAEMSKSCPSCRPQEASLTLALSRARSGRNVTQNIYIAAVMMRSQR